MKIYNTRKKQTKYNIMADYDRCVIDLQSDDIHPNAIISSGHTASAWAHQQLQRILREPQKRRLSSQKHHFQRKRIKYQSQPLVRRSLS